MDAPIIPPMIAPLSAAFCWCVAHPDNAISIATDAILLIKT